MMTARAWLTALAVTLLGHSVLSQNVLSHSVLAINTTKPIPLPNPLELLEPPRAPDARAHAQAGQLWTVLVYLHADNSLWVPALKDLREMMQVGSSDTVRFVVQIDAPTPKTENARGLNSFNGGLRVLIPRAPTTDLSIEALNAVIPKLNVIERLPEQNSDDPKVLSEFINWGIKRFPAQRYGVVLWDHGGAWKSGYGEDDTTGSFGMDTWVVREALKAGMAQSGLQRFDFLSFDACLMGGTELLFEYGDLSDVYIANPETDFGDGWDYTGAFNTLKNNPKITTRDFAKEEVRFYEAHHQVKPDDRAYHAHAAYDMAQLENLRGAINGFVAAATRSPDRAALLKARSSVTSYGLDTDHPNVPTEFIDLGQYAALVSDAATDTALGAAGRNLAAAVGQTVIAKAFGLRVIGASGLAVWLPNDPTKKPNTETLSLYSSRLRMTGLVNWKTFIDLWFGNIAPSVQIAGVSILRKTNLRDPSVRDPAVIGFNVTGDVNYVYGELGVVSGRNSFNVYGHLYLQNGAAGNYEYPWDGRWFTVIGANGSSDDYTGFYRQPNDNTIFANAVYTPPSGTQGFAVIVVADLGTARLTGVLDNSSIAPRDITLRPGGTLRFQFLQRDLLTDETSLTPTGRSVTVPAAGLESMRLERRRMPPGEYYLIFGARDAAGNIRSGNAPVQIR